MAMKFVTFAAASSGTPMTNKPVRLGASASAPPPPSLADALNKKGGKK